MQAAAQSVAQSIVVFYASTKDEIDMAFAAAARQRVDALLVGASAYYNRNREQIVAFAARYRIPASYRASVMVEAGGLTSYSDVRAESYRQAGPYLGRVLKGEKPADLPIVQPTRFEFAINLKTAKELGITFPPSFQLRADVVIE
jgi:putative ABC transport system substrate-binding protein